MQAAAAYGGGYYYDGSFSEPSPPEYPGPYEQHGWRQAGAEGGQGAADGGFK